MAESVFNKRRWKFFVALLVLCAVAAVAVGIGMHYYIGHGTDASDLAEVMPDSLVVGARFSLADMLESEGYTYGWTKDAVDVEVLVRTRPAGGQSVMSEEEGELSAQSGLLAYDAEEREFRVLGVGEGVLNIVNPVDDTVRIEIPFSTRFANSDTAEIFEANFPEADDDGFITAEEIAAVKILTIAEGGTFEVGEFDVFPELQSVVLTADGVSTLRGAAELDGVTYYVYDGRYAEYISSPEWRDIADRVYPIVDLADGVHTVVFEFCGGTIETAGLGAERTYTSVADGGKVDISMYVPTRLGYTFTGWFESDDNGETLAVAPVDNDTVYTSDTKLYAGWRANRYTVSYHDKDTVDLLPDPQTFMYGVPGSITEQEITRNGYSFAGWSLSEDAAQVDYLPGQEVLSLASEDGAEIKPTTPSHLMPTAAATPPTKFRRSMTQRSTSRVPRPPAAATISSAGRGRKRQRERNTARAQASKGWSRIRTVRSSSMRSGRQTTTPSHLMPTAAATPPQTFRRSMTQRSTSRIPRPPATATISSAGRGRKRQRERNTARAQASPVSPQVRAAWSHSMPSGRRTLSGSDMTTISWARELPFLRVIRSHTRAATTFRVPAPRARATTSSDGALPRAAR